MIQSDCGKYTTEVEDIRGGENVTVENVIVVCQKHTSSTHTHTVLLSLWGFSIGIMIFILHKLYSKPLH